MDGRFWRRRWTNWNGCSISMTGRCGHRATPWRRPSRTPSSAARTTGRADGRWRIGGAQCGLVPYWANDRRIAVKLINARGEALPKKPAFRQAFRRRRCVILADGYHGWRRAGARKQPYAIRRRDRRGFAIAGLFDRWSGLRGDGEDRRPRRCCPPPGSPPLRPQLSHRSKTGCRRS